jgi:hypothetical protein
MFERPYVLFYVRGYMSVSVCVRFVQSLCGRSVSLSVEIELYSRPLHLRDHTIPM